MNASQLARDARRLRALDQLREDRAAGLARWTTAAAALRWYVKAYISRSSAKGLSFNPDRVQGGGRDTRVEDRQFAAVIGAIAAAERDDRERNPKSPANLRRWLMQHFIPGEGRSYAWIAESEGRAEEVVTSRVERAVRVIRDRLRAGGWLTRRSLEGDE